MHQHSTHPHMRGHAADVCARAAFIVYDELQRRVWAARDRAGAQARSRPERSAAS